MKVLFRDSSVEHLGHGRTLKPLPGLGENIAHAADERMRRISIKRIEPKVHTAKRNSIKRQPRKIISSKNSLRRTMSRPLESQLRRDIVHLVKHAPDVHGTESRHQDTVGDAPVLLAKFCREEAVVGEVSDFPEFVVDGLLESCFVADFVDEFV